MSIRRDRNAPVRAAVKESCIPLLYGSDKAVRKTARQLYRVYRLRPFALVPKGSRPALFPPLYFTRISASYDSPQLLARFAVHFFKGLDPSAVPVLIDCTENGLFIRDPALRELLESHCFLSDHAHYREIPPFCYLPNEEND